MGTRKHIAPRVCILRRDYYPLIPHVRRDAETLQSAGISVDVICMRSPDQEAREDVNGVQVYRLPMSRRRGSRIYYIFEYLLFFLLASVTLAYLSIRKRYDAIEVDTMPDFLVFAAIIPKLLGAKVVLYLFECMPELFEDTYGLARRHPVIRGLRIIERYASRFADHVIYCGPGYRDIQEPRVGRSIKSTVVLNVPDESVFYPRSAIGPKPKENHEPFRVITHGSLLEKYGVQALVRAVPILRDKIPKLRVHIVGDGEYRETLEDLAGELDVNDIVTFTGMLPARCVADLISQSDVGVIAIQHPYMLPSKLFEYMAMQLPVVSSNIDFIRQFCGNGEVTFFAPGDEVELARRILSLHHNPAECSDQTERADQLYQSCSWSVTREKYLNVYRTLIEAKEIGEKDHYFPGDIDGNHSEMATSATGSRDSSGE